jgi:pyruvate dehydrogenase E1 component
VGRRATCAAAASCSAAPPGRTTLNGEGLQHEDGHSHLISATIPNCISYDPTFGYEVAVIVQDGLRRMYAEQQDVYYYLTVMNENYHHPAMPANAEADIIKGMYRFASGGADEEGRRARPDAGLGHDLPRGDRGGEAPERRLGRREPTCGAARASPSSRAKAWRSARWNMLHPADTRACRTSSIASRAPKAR